MGATQTPPDQGGGKDIGYGATSGDLDEHHLFQQSGKRFHFLDVVRIVCVGLVVVNHGGTKWSDKFGLWNEMYVQQWVLQWLFIVCGISFAMSSRNTPGYLARLGLYFAIGVCTNWCAWVITGMDWKHNFWDVIFQFWFIFGLMMYLIGLTPIKYYLKKVSAKAYVLPDSGLLGTVTAVAIIVAMVFMVHLCFTLALGPFLNVTLGRGFVWVHKVAGDGADFWGMPANSQESLAFIQELLSYLQVSFASLLILLIFPMVSDKLSLTTWLVLINMYAFRCIYPRGQFGRIVDGFDFTMLGLVNYHLGLSYRKTIGKYMVRYWFVILFVFSLIIPPGTFGRFDETGMPSAGFRIRYHTVELALVVLLLSAGELMADSKIFTEDKADFLNWWALYMFLFHKFIHLVIPHPFNWLVILCLAPICWVVHSAKRSDDNHDSRIPEQTDVEKAVATPTDQR